MTNMTQDQDNTAPARGRRSHFWRRAQSGQSLVILAIGFIALLAFVGIVTDVSLLFVRYSTLRRAVDAAAVSAAGQMRRVSDPNAGTAQGTSMANLNLAARQFIELYGLNSGDVVVETCYTQTLGLSGVASDRPLDRNGVFLYIYTANVRTGDNPAANADDRRKYEELCTDDELKLVRVTAEIQSPTVFMRLLGIPTITLQASAISQTAVIDVVLIMDVSESMLNDTSYADWSAAGYTDIPIPVQIPIGDIPRWEQTVSNSQGALAGLDPRNVIASYPNANPATASLPRVQCQARVFPTSLFQRSTSVSLEAHNLYNTVFNDASWMAANPNAVESVTALTTAGTYTGMLPTYDYYGCCNDPNGNGAFDDLICEPFKTARDAAFQFLNRLDFIRGDRVAFVTFDRTATLIDPDGSVGPQSPMIETQNSLATGDPVTSRRGAIETLRDVVGVRAEPSFYADTDDNGNWDAFVTLDADIDPSSAADGIISLGSGEPNAIPFGTAAAYYDGRRIGDMRQNPVRNDCPFWQAALFGYATPPEHLYRDYFSGAPRANYGDEVLNEIITPSWLATSYGDAAAHYRQYRSYEFRASCAGTNMGGALAQGSSALYDYGRREGSVWIMVLLSDGAAGGSNPVSRTDVPNPNYDSAYFPNPDAEGDLPYISDVAQQAQPYNTAYSSATFDNGDVGATVFQPIAGQYGGFGLCPYGTQASPGELVANEAFPNCSDIYPQTRHFCYGETDIPDTFVIDGPQAIAGSWPGVCEEQYDVDDYARDWADWVGLANIPGAAAQAASRFGDERLPTIFSIGFGLDYDPNKLVNFVPTAQCVTSDYTCRRNLRVEDYLGEELLRYIADVGDNARIDSDYWQNVFYQTGDARIPNQDLVTGTDYLQPGPCEDTTAGASGAWRPLPIQQDCGNYYNAPDGTRLNEVFNEIASRMFTRLSQ